MELLGYLAAAAIGVTLGLMGGGGSILTVPVLVYLFGVPAATATGDSLFLVGATAGVGAGLFVRQKQVDGRAAMAFLAPAFLTVWLTRRFLVPALPAHFGLLPLGTALLLLFAALMLVTAVSMLRPRPEAPEIGKPSLGRLVPSALGVGVLTGLVGAGGGFLIVPALALFARLPMKRAVGTSLAVIAANSLFGFFSDPALARAADWPFLLALTALALAGMGVGTALSKKVSGAALRPAFGVFLLVMGTYMAGHELFLNPSSISVTLPR